MKLFENGTPELEDGVVEIVSIARMPGVKTKIIVASDDEDVDPAGCLIGPKGMRVRTIVDELFGEKIDILNYTTNQEEMVRRALVPGIVDKIVIDEENNIIGVALTEIRREMSGLRTFNIVGLGGARFDEWRDEGDRVLRAWARSVDAPVVQLIGRRGWVKKLADLGWKEEAVIMRLDLRN